MDRFPRIFLNRLGFRNVAPLSTSRRAAVDAVNDMIVWVLHSTHIRIHILEDSIRMARLRVLPSLILVASAVFFPTPSYSQTARPSAQKPLQAQAPAPVQAPVSASSAIFELQSEALAWLQGLVRINTTNPPGNEIVAAKYIADILTKNGIPSEIFESTPGRGILVARLSASAVPDPSRALLLMAHLDVVGVDKSKWSVDPFGGIVKDGAIYGRGVLDDKGPLIANLAAFVALKRSGAHLTRDVIFLAEADEENGGDAGMKFAVEQHWDKIACGFSINEGGETVMKDGKVWYVGIQAAEKVASNVAVIATGTAGHASMPTKNNAVVHLSAAMAKLGAWESPVQFTAVTRAYFEGLAAIEEPETAKWMQSLESSDRGEHAARYLSNQNPFWNAVLHDTVTPTMLQAGIRVNVVPSEARGNLNIRQIPGNQLNDLLSTLTKVVADPQIRFEVNPGNREASPNSSLNSEFYQAIVKATSQSFPGAAAIPMMSPWATDSDRLRLRSVQAYGVIPFPLAESDYARMHSDDEQIPVDSFNKGIAFLYTLVSGFSVAQ
jgi:acetylornithine deacetylase/succinyl-diaminopimelate desuccinylase-like protein